MLPDSLERALHYAAGTVAQVTPRQLGAPTPCRNWDLGMLLRHGCESLAALTEGLSAGVIARCGSTADVPAEFPGDPARAFVAAAIALLGCCRAAEGSGTRKVVSIAGCPLTTGALLAAGTLEIAVHGWDVAQACGGGRPIPPGLAGDLLQVAPLLVTEGDRAPLSAAPLFAAPVSVPGPASPSDRLTAFLGRSPLRSCDGTREPPARMPYPDSSA